MRLRDTKLTKAHWTSLYRIHRRMTDRFRRDRCFLIGDAAHIHSPAGGQGMNLAIGDGFNLAWKLALVAKGDARFPLLDSYEAERVRVARQVLDGTDRGFELEATQDRFLDWFKIHVFPLILRIATNFAAVQNTIFELFSQTWISYADSPAVADAAPIERSPKAGDRAPYGLLVDGDRQSQSLFERLRGIDHHLLLFAGRESTIDLPGFEKTVQNLLDRYRFPSQLVAIERVNRSLHGRYGASSPRLVFLRPDGHIGSLSELNINYRLHQPNSPKTLCQSLRTIRAPKDAISRDILKAFDNAAIGIATTTYNIVGLPLLQIANSKPPKSELR